MTVKLRQRKQNSKGRTSLYLEFYRGKTTLPDGKTKYLRDYEYLDLFLIEKPKTAIDRQQNKQNLELANTIRAQRELDIKNNKFGFHTDRKDTNFISYFYHIAQKKEGGTKAMWLNAIRQLIYFAYEELSLGRELTMFSGEIIRLDMGELEVKHIKMLDEIHTNLTFDMIDERFCENYREHLLTKVINPRTKENLSTTTANIYFTYFHCCFKQAIKERIIQFDPCINTQSISVIEGVRNYLTLGEIRALANTDCKNKVLKRAFLFACLVGLRISDVRKLKWSDIKQDEKQWSISFNQKKTKKLQYLPIPEQAKKYLGETESPDTLVFYPLSAYALKNWAEKAGLKKHLSFHCSRHSFAVLQLEAGTSLVTLKNLLGHSRVETTMKYAKITDGMLQKAMTAIPEI
ncbi:MAG: site-specific integrase [Ignavibacteria bacterium]|jgi:integrase|nr:site-specific integrase [Ignavibacteria bacterium]